jgi:SAM-dependent methyltransferase
MCNPAVIRFGSSFFSAEEVSNKRVLEVGSRDINGSLRSVVEKLLPFSYWGVDVAEGPGVDEICDVHDLVTRFGKDSFDVVICTEVLEHVYDWRSAISNLKNVVKPGGVLFVSTRSKGFPEHDFPADFWRYELRDMRRIFRDMRMAMLKSDPFDPGVVLKALKPASFSECSLRNQKLLSAETGKKSRGTDEPGVLLLWTTRALQRLGGGLWSFGARVVSDRAKVGIRRFGSRVLPTGVKAVAKRSMSWVSPRARQAR